MWLFLGGVEALIASLFCLGFCADAGKSLLVFVGWACCAPCSLSLLEVFSAACTGAGAISWVIGIETSSSLLLRSEEFSFSLPLENCSLSFSLSIPSSSDRLRFLSRTGGEELRADVASRDLTQ